MQRRDFLKAPALGMLLPAVGSGGMMSSLSDQTTPSNGQASDARKFPQRIHQDFETYVSGIEYFPLGNGEIQAILQYCPERSGSNPQTFLGLAIMDAERFSRKVSTFLFHPERGLERTMAVINVDGKVHTVTPNTFKALRWKHVDKVPVVSLTWTAGAIDVEEEFYVFSREPLLMRAVTLQNRSAAAASVRVAVALTANFLIFDDIGPDEKENTINGHGFADLKLQCLESDASTAGRYDIVASVPSLESGASRQVRFVYSIRATKGGVTPQHIEELWKSTVKYWAIKELLSTGNEVLDHLYSVSRNGMKALTAKSGKRDSGYWMYNMQWARDDIMMVMGMLHAGFHDEARTLLAKVLDYFVARDGRITEASRWVANEHAELDQNGVILYGVWSYLCWTGDREFVKRYWPKLKTTGDFPIQDFFQDPTSRLLHNKREFWERNDSFGVEDGYELVYQFWVAIGLEKGGEIARLLGDRQTAQRWQAASAELRTAFLSDPKYKLIEEGHLIKRRTLDGRWQRYMVPVDRATMPPGSPIATEERPECEPDTGSLYPIIYRTVDPLSDLSRKTIQDMERLWNQSWTHGGYSRYNTTSEPDPPGPWPIGSLLVARAAIEAGDSQRAWRSLNWVRGIHGGLSGGWFERYGPSITPPAPPVGIVGWAWAEVVMLCVQHLMGVQPGLDTLVIRPRLIDGLDRMEQTFTVQGSKLTISIKKTKEQPRTVVAGKVVPMEGGGVRLPYPKKGSAVRVAMEVV